MEKEARQKAELIFRAALRAADPYLAVSKETANIRNLYESGGFKRLFVVGMGKASHVMARALHDSLGNMFDRGIVITKHGSVSDYSPGATKIGNIEVHEGGHPIPDEAGLRATSEILRLLESADSETLVICLISGGGSALLVKPANNVSLREKQNLTDALLRSGADITELNAVRKHISDVKGGRLAQAAYPARIVSFIISDVIGDSLEVIASGPTSPDSSTYADALDVLMKYSITPPESVKKLIHEGLDGKLSETPGEDSEIFTHVENRIIVSNQEALRSALLKAKELGMRAEILTNELNGDAEEAAVWLFEKVFSHRDHPACLISGGETTVRVTGTGKGGRNMHLALRFALEAEGSSGVTLLSAGTDGTDGPTEAAGAVVDETTSSNARGLGIDPAGYLKNCDSYNFFRQAGGLLITGPTGTNVMDIQVIIIE